VTPQVRVLLESVLEAIDLPAPATEGDYDAYARLLVDRVLDAVVFLTGVLADPLAGTVEDDWNVAYLRRQLAKKPPTTYRHYRDLAGGEQP
jgi:hypothetical protein